MAHFTASQFYLPMNYRYFRDYDKLYCRPALGHSSQLLQQTASDTQYSPQPCLACNREIFVSL